MRSKRRLILVGLLILSGAVVAVLLPRWRSGTRSNAPVIESAKTADEGYGPADLIDSEIRRTLSSGEAHGYRLRLAAGEYALVTVRQRGVDVSVARLDPEGEEGERLDSPNGSEGVETLSLVGRDEGPVRLEVRNESGSASPGTYEISVARRPIERSDETRLAAQAAYARGLRMQLEEDPPRLEEALEQFRTAAELWREIGDRPREAYARVRMGEILWRVDRRPTALESLRTALEQHRASSDAPAEVWTLFRIGRLRAELGEPRAAFDHYREVLEKLEGVGDRELQSNVLNSTGSVLDDLGRKSEALEHYERALELARELGHQALIAGALGNTGVTLDDIGESERALQHHREVLALHRQAGNRYEEAVTLHNIGSALDKIGEKQESLESYRQALAAFIELGNRRGQAYVHLNMGRLYSTLGEGEAALRHYDEALAVASAVADRRLESWALSNLGGLHKKLGDVGKAEEYLARALPLRRQVGDRRGEAFTLNSLGDLQLERGRTEPASELFRQALEAWREVGDRRGESSSLLGVGRLHENAGELGRALDTYVQAYSVLGSVQDPEGEAKALFGQARVLKRQGELEEGRARIETALDLLESLRYRLASQGLRSSFFASKRRYYEFYVDLLMELDREEPDGGWAAAAFQASERARARSLLETLFESGGEIRQGVDPGVLERERSLRRRLNAKHWRRTRLARRAEAESESLAALDLEIEDLLDQLRAARGEIRSSSPAYAALTQPQPVSLGEIQSRLDPGSLLLEFALGEERSYLWAVAKQSFTVFRLPPRSEIEALARRYAELLRRGSELEARLAVDGVAASLARMLLPPIAADLLSGRRLLVVPEGALQYIPFAALPAPGSTTEPATPLVVKHEILTLPSASILAARASRDVKRAAATGLAVLADPVFAAEDPRVVRSPGSGSDADAVPDPDADPAFLTRAARDFGGGRFPRLPFTRHEAEAIIALAGSGQTFKALDFDANLSVVTGGRLAPYRIVHFATHGLLNATHPELSGLVLSLVDRDGGPQDGFLRLHDAYNLDLRAELVVLSGCETALGKEIQGEGLVGLTRGFMYAGAAGVVASLWTVDDEATAELMESFYEGLLNRGLSPAAALRDAQTTLWRRPATAAAYYWAGFLYQGP